jgi:GGDEF domain-containing protein
MIVEIEFRNNGVIDSLTHAPAPAHFFDNLHREFSRANRETKNISLISLQSMNCEHVTEFQLTALARAILRHLRSDEFFTRISESGFWIYVKGDSLAAEKLASRIMQDEDSQWRCSIVECQPTTTIEEWIHAIDLQHFSAD